MFSLTRAERSCQERRRHDRQLLAEHVTTDTMSAKEIRDPVHGPISLSPKEFSIIDHPMFQRLRNIKQLGFGEYAFPGATHNRFSHSLGVLHLADTCCEHIFAKQTGFAAADTHHIRQLIRLAALLHDIGHGPLSHTTEEAMPAKKDLCMDIFNGDKRPASHEDYSIKIILDSDLRERIVDIAGIDAPQQVATLIRPSLRRGDEFVFGNIDFLPIFSQLVSSELDADRMDYLLRDSLYCGVNYGTFDKHWLMSKLALHQDRGAVYLAIDKNAIYAFDDFLIARYHMYLMCYFHPKAVIFDEILLRHLRSPSCSYRIPVNINEYVDYDDYHLFERLRRSDDPWARRIIQRDPYRVCFDRHGSDDSSLLNEALSRLRQHEIDFICSSSTGILSKYYSPGTDRRHQFPIFVTDSLSDSVELLEDATTLFQRYREARQIDRIYVAREDLEKVRRILQK